MANRLLPQERLERAQELGILVDEQDRWLLEAFSWRVTAKGYVETTHYDGNWRKTTKLHHYIIGTPLYEGDETDHGNRNKLDNRRHNIKLVDIYTNAQNKQSVDDATNVRFHKGSYEARIQRNGVVYYGYGQTEQEARYSSESKYRGRQAELASL